MASSMRRHAGLRSSVWCALLALSWPTGAAAQQAAGHRHGQGPTVLSVGVGFFDVTSVHGAVDFRLELRSGRTLAGLAAWAQAAVTSQSAGGGFGGLYADIPLGSALVLTPSTGIGLWSSGRGKDLGSAVEFRSTIEITVRVASDTRVGVSLGHLSNAGTSRRNPGANVLALSYVRPLNRSRR